jgi:hypothetical protein
MFSNLKGGRIVCTIYGDEEGSEMGKVIHSDVLL